MPEHTESLTAKKLREFLHYDPSTGEFRWKKRGRGYPGVGKLAGSTSHERGYRTISIEGRSHLAHRLAWLYVHGEFPANELDHIDRNTDNNAIANLRACTRRDNAFNTVRHPGATSRYPGVSWDKGRGKWVAKIRMPDGKRRQLGRFDDEAEAAAAYAVARNAINPFRAAS